MKAVNLAVSFIFIAATASAQSNASAVQVLKAPKAKLIGQSNFGKVYALPQDNMPCIVAPTATEAVMPVAKAILLKPGIPNGFPNQDLVATNTAPAIFFKPGYNPKQASKNLMLDLIRKK